MSSLLADRYGRSNGRSLEQTRSGLGEAFDLSLVINLIHDDTGRRTDHAGGFRLGRQYLG